MKGGGRIFIYPNLGCGYDHKLKVLYNLNLMNCGIAQNVVKYAKIH
jgi:hypothetical protein